MVLEATQPCHVWIHIFFLNHREGGVFSFLFTSNSLATQGEVCQTFIKSFSFPTTLTMPIIHQASPRRSGFILVIHARNCKKKERFTSHPQVCLISAKWGQLVDIWTNLIYLMESLFPDAVTFSIQICFKWIGKTMQSHFTKCTISTSQTGGWKLTSSLDSTLWATHWPDCVSTSDLRSPSQVPEGCVLLLHILINPHSVSYSLAGAIELLNPVKVASHWVSLPSSLK